MKGNTKEQVKNRMIKKAAALWGVAPNEIEMSFDPVITLLITALAFEIEKISGEIKESQTRVTEKLIQLMTPETVYGAKPAHAILYTEPIEKNTLIKPEYLFYHKKKFSYKNTSVKYRNIYFSPVQNFNLINAAVKYIATGNQILEVDKKKNKETISQNINGLPSSTLYLGISPNSGSISLNDISFYFELQDVEDKDLFYHHLKNTKWFVNEKEIVVSEGFYNTNKSHKVNLDIIFNDTSTKTSNICLQTNKIYSKHYITVKSKKGTTIKKSNFKELDIIIKNNKIDVDDGVLWLKIEFPRIISNTSLKNVYCSLNSFPVLNRELIDFTYQMKEFIDIIPIKTEDSFLDMKSVTNTRGELYKSSIKNDSNIEKGTYLIRNDNVGKLEHRKAKEYIVHLIELLKDESASFSIYNNDFLQMKLEDLNQLLSLLEKKVKEISNETTETSYVFLKPYRKKETILVEYWTTNGHAANGIKSGSALEIYKGVGVEQRSSFLMTPTLGGESDLSMQERLNAYRRSLLSRDRIVTKEDIKVLCYEMYGDKIEKVEVIRGYTNDIALKKGSIQCIEILLYPNNNVENSEWESLNSNLLLFLEKNSLNVFPYRIKLVN